jgi:hypothetical protein
MLSRFSRLAENAIPVSFMHKTCKYPAHANRKGIEGTASEIQRRPVHAG